MFQVAAVYAVVTWLIVQIVSTIEEPLALPPWFDTAIIVLLAIGFPITLIVSWAFDVTPDGLIKDSGSEKAQRREKRTIEVALLALLLLAGSWIVYREMSPDSRLPSSIAVLPFEAFSSNAEDEYFALGIHDTILNELAKISNLNVIARTSVLQYSDSDLPLSRIAEELGVLSILEGTVQYADGQVRITAQLIDPDSGSHMWSGNYDREFKDLFSVQSEIAERIAFALEAELLPSEREQLQERSTTSPEAWLLYIRAMEAIDWDIRPNPPPQAVEAFHSYLSQALEHDPAFALAHAYKAYDYSMSVYRTAELGGPTEQEIRALAMEHLDSAMAIDSNLGMVWGARGMAAWSEWVQHSEAAQFAFERGVQLSPSNRDIRDDLIRYSAYEGNYERAMELAEEALRLDPNQAGYWLNRFSIVSMASGNVDDTVEYAEQAMALSGGGGPASEGALRRLAWGAIVNGDTMTAADYLGQLEAILAESGVVSGLDLALLAYGYSRAGNANEARRLVDEINELSNTHAVGLGSRALAALALGDIPVMTEHLEEAYQSRIVDEGIDCVMLIAINSYDDEVLRQPELIEIRERLRASVGWAEVPWD